MVNSAMRDCAAVVILHQKQQHSIMENKGRKGNLQLVVAGLMCFAGTVLLGAGFVTPPAGEIDSSVLVAFGEMLTFAGALFGIDYTYRK